MSNIISERLVLDSSSATLSSFGWSNELGLTDPFAVDNNGWYEDLSTYDSIIGVILSKKFKKNTVVFMGRALPHPADIYEYAMNIKRGNDPNSYVFKYERFEIITPGKVYSHILVETVNYSNDNFILFDTNTDIPDTVSSVVRTENRYIHNIGKVNIIRRICLSYDKILSIEPIIHVYTP